VTAVTIQERGYQGWKGARNALRIISVERSTSLQRRGQSAALTLLGSIGCKTLHPTDKGDPQRQVVDAKPKKGCRGAAIDFGRSDPARILAGGSGR
jgi:hypothetical protein